LRLIICNAVVYLFVDTLSAMEDSIYTQEVYTPQSASSLGDVLFFLYNASVMLLFADYPPLIVSINFLFFFFLSLTRHKKIKFKNLSAGGGIVEI
jgi:hypothetical protein